MKSCTDPCTNARIFPSFVNCLVYGNTATSSLGAKGGAFHLNVDTEAAIVNCTVADNEVIDGASPFDFGGAFYIYSACVPVDNSIVYGNDAPVGDEVYDGNSAHVIFTYTEVAQATGDIEWCAGECCGDIDYGYEVINADPRFVGGGDYHLCYDSPCIDHGDNCKLPDDVADLDDDDNTGEVLPYDLDRNARRVDLPGAPDDGNDCSDPPMVDMGVYEEVAAEIIDADPPTGTVDARQPYAPAGPPPYQGIGSASEPITVTLDPVPTTGADVCTGSWTLCETDDRGLGANSIDSVTDLGSGVYELTLARAITPGEVTTISYVGSATCIEYFAHPANANGNSSAAAEDASFMIDMLNGVAQPPHGMYSQDIDHSGLFTSADLTRLIDLLNGAGAYDAWAGTSLPVNDTCACTPYDEADSFAVGAADESTSTDGDFEVFAGWLVPFLTTIDPQTQNEVDVFEQSVDVMIEWLFCAYSSSELESLAETLEDPNLVYASEYGTKGAEEIVAAIRE